MGPYFRKYAPLKLYFRMVTAHASPYAKLDEFSSECYALFSTSVLFELLIWYSRFRREREREREMRERGERERERERRMDVCFVCIIQGATYSAERERERGGEGYGWMFVCISREL